MARLNPSVLVDVGANYGEFSCSIASLNQPLIVLEANPMLVPCLKKTFASALNVTVIHAAASNCEGEVRFYFDKRATGSVSMSNAPRGVEAEEHVVV